MVQIDAQGLSCPEPVILTMNQINKNEKEIEKLLNSACSVENVTKLATSKNYNIEKINNDNNEVTLILKK